MDEGGEVMWRPDQSRIDNANITAFSAWLAEHEGIDVHDYAALWQWSVDEPARFWLSLWRYYDVQSTEPPTTALGSSVMPGAEWFPGARLNYVDQVYRHAGSDAPAVICQTESGATQSLSWSQMRRQTAALAHTLRDELNVKPGDRVVAYMQNIPETIVAFHAVASIGAVWSVCAPDLGVRGVLDRFSQIEPVVLIASDGYHYGGKAYPRATEVRDLLAGLPSVRACISVPALGEVSAAPDKDAPASGNSAARASSAGVQANITHLGWERATKGEHTLSPIAVDFAHPLWVVYSSGTTGKPKAIVHGHGGILLEHLKQVGLQLDLGAGDRFMWFSSTAWMMWNYNIAGLLVGATVCLFDGNPGKPDLFRLWQVVDDLDIHYFGAGAAYFEACKNASLSPRERFGLKALRSMGATGSPLLPDVFDWIYREVGEDIYLSSISGGTDFASACVGGSPTLPVWRGEIACRSLGCAVYAFDDNAMPVVDAVGELVITVPMPSMPVYFWNDSNDEKYIDAYFSTFPGVWRHGDWIRITSHGSAVIYGRSDSTINRQGIRMGTSELYQVVEALPEIVDSLVVDLEFMGRESYLPLFIVLGEGVTMSDALLQQIRGGIRENLSPRHVPDDVFVVADIPRTFSGKKMEIPVRRLLLGQGEAAAINRDTMANPGSIDWFVDFAARLEERRPA